MHYLVFTHELLYYPSPMHWCIVVLKDIIICRGMAYNNWLYIIVQYLNICLSINVTIYHDHCANAFVCYTAQYHNAQLCFNWWVDAKRVPVSPTFLQTYTLWSALITTLHSSLNITYFQELPTVFLRSRLRHITLPFVNLSDSELLLQQHVYHSLPGIISPNSSFTNLTNSMFVKHISNFGKGGHIISFYKPHDCHGYLKRSSAMHFDRHFQLFHVSVSL